MDPDAWLLFLACAFVAEVLGTMAGFGAATILTPVAVLFMDVKTAIAVVAVFHFFGNGSRLIFFGRHVQWRTWLQFGMTGMLLTLVGAAVTTRLPSSVIVLLFGGFLLTYVGLSLAASDRVQLPRTPAVLVGGGALSGFITGLIGTGGAVRSACLLAFGLSKETYIGTSAAIALVVDATRLPVYLTGGFLPGAMAPVLVSLVVAAFAGAWLGRQLVQRISPVVFRRVVMAMLALMGLKMLFDGWHGLS